MSLLRFVLFILLFWSTALLAQGVLVAWEPGEAQPVLNLPGTASVPAVQVEGQQLSTPDHLDYELFRYEIEDRTQRLSLIRELRGKPQIRFVELDGQVDIQSTNQPRQFDLLGFSEPTTWGPTQFACETVPIAIIDTGVDTAHTDLNHNDFRVNENLIMGSSTGEDDHGHGTHIAGLIAARSNENVKVAGVCSTATIFNYKFFDKDGKGGNITHAIQAINESVTKGAGVINASWTYSGYSQSLYDTIAGADHAGVYIIAAAGNAGSNNDTDPVYPAIFSNKFKHVVAVANAASLNALNQTPGEGSNYGYQTVDFAAPGTSLPSTYYDNHYVAMTGTSMAAPLASASLAALMQMHSGYPSEAYRAALLNNIWRGSNSDFEGKLKYPGLLNAQAMLNSTAASVFSSAWFNYQWIEGVDVLRFQGYKLNEVVSARMEFPGEGSVSIIPDIESATALRVSLPANWQEGTLFLRLNSGEDLHPLDFSLMQSATVPESYTWCDGATCETTWRGYFVQVTRDNYDKAQQGSWSLYTIMEGEEELLLINAEDLSDSWSFNISGDFRLRFEGMNYRLSTTTFKELSSGHGYTQQNDNNANWVINKKDGWPYATKLYDGMYQLTLKPQIRLVSSSPSTSSEPAECYIATSVYGDVYAPEVDALRNFRNEVLMEFGPGRWLVDQYYTYSPAVAQWMDDKPRLQAVVRWGLDAFVGFWRWIKG
ncbi:S8 family serine peptidase [Marinospirillum sp.]|uniref:S8 family serine peptidase n=1 Tax=Marinospirillum sp. TaxID=2183934 RepID=UPI0038511EF4